MVAEPSIHPMQIVAVHHVNDSESTLRTTTRERSSGCDSIDEQ